MGKRAKSSKAIKAQEMLKERFKKIRRIRGLGDFSSFKRHFPLLLSSTWKPYVECLDLSINQLKAIYNALVGKRTSLFCYGDDVSCFVSEVCAHHYGEPTLTSVACYLDDILNLLKDKVKLFDDVDLDSTGLPLLCDGIEKRYEDGFRLELACDYDIHEVYASRKVELAEISLGMRSVLNHSINLFPRFSEWTRVALRYVPRDDMHGWDRVKAAVRFKEKSDLCLSLADYSSCDEELAQRQKPASESSANDPGDLDDVSALSRDLEFYSASPCH